MRFVLAFTLVVFASLQAVLGCGPAVPVASRKQRVGCFGRKRFRQICASNPTNAYREEEIPGFYLSHMGPSWKWNDTVHTGLDIECSPEFSVHAPFRGKITRLDNNNLTLLGLHTFQGYAMNMNNFNVSSSLSINTIVAAGQCLGIMTRVRPHDGLEGVSNYVHITTDIIGYSTVDPSWYICPVSEWPNKSRKFYAIMEGRNRFVNVDYDKQIEEAEVTEKEMEMGKNTVEGSADEEDSEGSTDP